MISDRPSNGWGFSTVFKLPLMIAHNQSKIVYVNIAQATEEFAYADDLISRSVSSVEMAMCEQVWIHELYRAEKIRRGPDFFVVYYMTLVATPAVLQKFCSLLNMLISHRPHTFIPVLVIDQLSIQVLINLDTAEATVLYDKDKSQRFSYLDNWMSF